MLKPAELYVDLLNRLMMEASYDISNKYFFEYPEDITDNNTCRYVSIDDHNRIIGYISYSVTRSTRCANNISIISFDKGNIKFIKDIYYHIDYLFMQMNVKSIVFYALSKNPIIKSYYKFIKYSGGFEVGIILDYSQTYDGIINDFITYQITKEGYVKSRMFERLRKTEIKTLKRKG